ncbi:(2Fe-2S)-binding protein [Actinoplanes oblitus]|uniref:(2Fe-2S)-binding protein n=1 Tax=Actinoplanes oblitus TaxID=3040509 RepID=A0ABY8WPH7_9ACTN|nr:(2Fe-2S)-binding protein [Actinoplanes oblitus]WIM99332.1 (2Fe-2S)-binding protein [Actinoplanes oblitus]
MTVLDASAALAAAGQLGPYFTWEPWAAGAPWRPFGELLDERVLAERVDLGRDTLTRMSGLDRAAIGEREVASITFLGLASRLLSPLLAAAAVGGALPLPDPDRLWWQPAPAGPLPIAFRDLTAEPCAGWTPGRIAETGLLDLAGPLLTVFRDRFALSPQVLWGNVASALGGASGMIADGRPECAARSAAIVEAALRLPPLRGAAASVQPDPRHERWFLVRRNCCLYYRIPGGGTCGDCVLTPEADRHRHWQAVLSRAASRSG